MFALNDRNYLEHYKKNPNSKIIERFSIIAAFDGTFNPLSEKRKIGTLKTITQNMEVSFEMKIQNMDECRIGGCNYVLLIPGWFRFDITKSPEESKFHIRHRQMNGLGDHDDIPKKSPISFSNSWKKEFLFKF